MKTNIICVLGVIFLIIESFLLTVSALECFVCNSAYDEQCDSKLPLRKYLVNCTNHSAKPQMSGGITDHLQLDENINFTSCRKIDSTIPTQTNGAIIRHSVHRIVRSCGWLDNPIPDHDVCKVLSQEKLLLEECSCISDACNSGGELYNSPILMCIIFLTAGILPFYLFSIC